MSSFDITKSVRDFVDAIQDGDKRKSAYDTQATVLRIDGDTAWVHIPGGVDETPVRKTMNAKSGDRVQVRVAKGKAWLTGNATSPPTDDTKANEADKKAGVADKKATYAEEISKEALERTERIQGRVDQAEENITIIETEIDALDDRVDTATGKITTIEGNIETLDGRVDAAEADISTVEGNITTLTGRVDTAEGNITTVETNITNLTGRVSDAEDDIDDTLKGLALAQDVIGTLAWITAHSKETADTIAVPGKVYYIKNQDGTFTVVTDTASKNPYDEGWWEMDEAMNNYIAAHLAMTNDGLIVTKDNSKWKILVKDNGIDIIDGTSGINKVVASYGAGVTFSDERVTHIGNSNAYIIFNPDNGGSITIGGANITLGDQRSLDDVLASMDSTISNTLIYDHTYQYTYDTNNKAVSATFTAFLYRGGVDVKYELDENDDPKYPPSQFTWYLKKEDSDGIKEIPIIVDPTSDPTNSGYQCTVSLADCGYGAEVIGKFTSLDNAEALANNGDNLTDINNEPLSVRATGDSIRVRDLTTVSTIFPTEKLMVVGAEDEHLITAETLYNYILNNLNNDFSVIYCGSATELVG